MKITKIEIQKKNKNRVNLYLDENFFCGLSLETIMKCHIKEGQEITAEQVEFLKTETEKQVALSKAVGFISKSQKTKKEIFDYLTKKGFEEEILQFVLSKLEEYGFVDDELYAKNYVKFKTKSNGEKKIKFELKKKGIEENLVSSSIEEFSNDKENIFFVLEKYLKNKNLDLKTKQKAYRFLASKGYGSENILRALDKNFKNLDDRNESWN